MTKAQIEKMKREAYYEASKSISLILSMALRDEGDGRDELSRKIGRVERYCNYVFEKNVSFHELEQMFDSGVKILEDEPMTNHEWIKSLGAEELGYALCEFVTKLEDSCEKCPFGEKCSRGQNGAIVWANETYKEEQ